MIEIYMLTHKTTLKPYVGMTSRKAYGNGNLITRAKKKHSADSFNLTILNKTDSKQEADGFERFYIKLFNSIHPNGYNLALGGDGGSIHTEDIKQRLSATLKRGYIEHPERANKISKALKGRVSPNKGKKTSDETKAKLSTSLIKTAFKHSTETKEMMRQKFTGRVMSEETKAKMSASAKRRANTPEGRERMLKASLKAKESLL